MKTEITGKILRIGDVQTFGTFNKREIVIEFLDGKYPQTVPIELHQDRTSLADGYSEGDEVTVHCDIRGNYYAKTDRYFAAIVGWKIEGQGSGTNDVQVTESASVADVQATGDDSDQLPF